MEEIWRAAETADGGPEEVVLTYRQPEGVEPVTLRYERDLPACMRPRPAKEPEPPARPAGDNPLNPPERPRARWGVRLYVAASLLVILACLGTGVWYVSQYGWTLPGSRQEARRAPGDWYRDDWDDGWDYRDYWGDYDWDSLPPLEGSYEWNMLQAADDAITIPAYPTGGETRLALAPARDLPELTAKEVYDRVTPSVVAVLGTQRMSRSEGTGVIFSPDGYILTNCHVIAGSSSCDVWVTNAYGVVDEYAAKVVGYDEDQDLAVLKIEARDLTAAAFGVSDDLQVGDPVYAIGNPLGIELRNTLTDGIVSAVNRDVDVDGVAMTLIQTTAALNSGNSGGPLINRYGQVIGINTIKMMSSYDTIEGLGFAIPSSFALRWVNELIEFGELQPQPVLGVTVNRIPETLPDGRRGLPLEEISPGLSGDRAGLRAGDVLVGFGGQDVLGYEQLLGLRRQLRVGDEVPVQVWRDGEYLDFTMIMMAE